MGEEGASESDCFSRSPPFALTGSARTGAGSAACERQGREMGSPLQKRTPSGRLRLHWALCVGVWLGHDLRLLNRLLEALVIVIHGGAQEQAEDERRDGEEEEHAELAEDIGLINAGDGAAECVDAVGGR